MARLGAGMCHGGGSCCPHPPQKKGGFGEPGWWPRVSNQGTGGTGQRLREEAASILVGGIHGGLEAASAEGAAPGAALPPGSVPAEEEWESPETRSRLGC